MKDDRLRTLGRWLLGLVLLVAGIGHLTTQRTEFQAQVPDWFPVDGDTVVVAYIALENDGNSLVTITECGD